MGWRLRRGTTAVVAPGIREGPPSNSAHPCCALTLLRSACCNALAQRWKHFIALLLLSGLMFVLAGAFLPLVLLRPQKFCLFFSLGSILSMASFAVLRGPIEQLKHMFSLQRLPFTSTYIGSLVLTLYAAFVMQSYLLVLLFMALQAGALGWYLLSYIPGGAPILKVLTRTTVRLLSALCCRGSSSGGWMSSSGSGAYSLLPL